MKQVVVNTNDQLVQASLLPEPIQLVSPRRDLFSIVAVPSQEFNDVRDLHETADHEVFAVVKGTLNQLKRSLCQLHIASDDVSTRLGLNTSC